MPKIFLKSMEPSKRLEAEEDKEPEDSDTCLTYPEKLKTDSEVAQSPSRPLSLYKIKKENEKININE